MSDSFLPCLLSAICYLLFSSRDTEARGIHVSVCTGRRPGKPDKALQLRVPKVNQPRPRISRSSEDAQGAFQTRIYRVLGRAILRVQNG